MRALRTAARGIRRVLSRATRHGALPASASALSAEDADTEAMLREVKALHLEAFQRRMRRYTRPDLAQLGADLADSAGTDLAGVREAAALTVAQFAEWEAACTARATRATAAAVQRSETAATVANVAARLLALVPQILRRASARVLRPRSPRAPAPACLA